MADVAFEANGSTIEELFVSAAEATTCSMVDKLESVMAKKKVKVELKAANVEQLLQDFLQELIFYKDAKQMLFSKYEIEIVQEGKKGEWKLIGKLCGEKLDPKKHALITDVKAVSWHKFGVKQEKKGSWKAFVILDV